MATVTMHTDPIKQPLIVVIAQNTVPQMMSQLVRQAPMLVAEVLGSENVPGMPKGESFFQERLQSDAELLGCSLLGN